MHFEFDVLVCGVTGCSHLASQCFWFSWSHRTFLKHALSSHPGSPASLSWEHFEEILGLGTFPSWSIEHMARQLLRARLQLKDWVWQVPSELSSWLMHRCLCHTSAKRSLAFYWITDPLWALSLSLSPRPAVDWFFSEKKLLRHKKGQRALGKSTAYLPTWIVWSGLGDEEWGEDREEGNADFGHQPFHLFRMKPVL